MSDWLKNTPAQPSARFLLAHGAGAPMDTEFMQSMAEGLCARGIDVWRFEFPYMAQRRTTGKKRPPSPQPQLLDAFREALEQALTPALPLFIGGKSMGGRMASLLADEQSDVSGVICLGYPFHPPGKPEKTRIAHLQNLKTPCLMVQGTRDPMGSQDEVAGYPLGKQVRFHWLEDGNHDFKPRVKSGHSQSAHWNSAQMAAADFIADIMRGVQ